MKTFQNNKPNSQTSTEEFVNIFDFLRKKGSNLNLENDINEFFKKIINKTARFSDYQNPSVREWFESNPEVRDKLRITI